MPRKATDPAKSGEAEGAAAAPRRSSRIKDQPKEVAPKKPKSRAKKADKDAADKEEKPKSARGKKRKAEDETPNGGVDDATAPTDKKVRFFF
jgi:hypothetical protein